MKVVLIFLLLALLCCELSVEELRCPGSDILSGWTCDYEVDGAHRNGDYDFCDFDTISVDYPIEKFNNNYLFKKPVLINSTWSDWLKKNISFFFKSSLLKEFGSYQFDSGRSLDLVLNAGIGKIKITLNNYLNLEFSNDGNKTKNDSEIESLYVFDRSLFAKYIDFIKYFSAPLYLDQIAHSDQYGILFLGVTGTGATWHAHGETWQGSVFGRKRWFLYPPEFHPVGGFFPGYSSKDWYKTIYKELNETIPIDYDSKVNGLSYPSNSYRIRKNIFKRGIDRNLNSNSTVKDIMMTDFEIMNKNGKYGLYKPLECIVKEGQILYIPEFWWHAIYNIGDSLGIAVQSARYYTPWMQTIERMQEYDKNKIRYNEYSDLERERFHFDILNIHQVFAEEAPNCVVHTYFIGEENMGLGNFDIAEIYLIKTIKMDPTFIGAYVSLYKLYSKINKIKEAEMLLRIAYILNPRHPEVRTELIQLFKLQNKHNLRRIVEEYQPLPPREQNDC